MAVDPEFGYKDVPLHNVTAPEYAMMQNGHFGKRAIRTPGIQEKSGMNLLFLQLCLDEQFFMWLGVHKNNILNQLFITSLIFCLIKNNLDNKCNIQGYAKQAFIWPK
jgi:hypothetical protein